ncbi:MAG: gamma-glutamylcyclotransferase [Pseudomonadota bacterium]|nr:gamma-glutamylcyclotransferase [Pseudomonadota bacterium]
MVKVFSRTEILALSTANLWFFAYGSLIWEPGFEAEDRCHGRLRDWHRLFCIDSILYREKP